MIGIYRRTSVMVNGRGLLSGQSSESRLKGICAMGAAVVLLLVACVVLGTGSRHYAQKAVAPTSSFPIPAAFAQASKSKPDARALLSHLPLIFEPNQGQAGPSVKFVSRGPGYSLYLDSTGAML